MVLAIMGCFIIQYGYKLTWGGVTWHSLRITSAEVLYVSGGS